MNALLINILFDAKFCPHIRDNRSDEETRLGAPTGRFGSVARRSGDGRRTKATSERNSDPRDHATPQAGANTERSADATSPPQAGPTLTRFPLHKSARAWLAGNFAGSREVDLN